MIQGFSRSDALICYGRRRDSALPFELAAMECAIKQATEDLELQLVSITPRVGNLLTVLPTQMNATLLNELRLVKQVRFPLSMMCVQSRVRFLSISMSCLRRSVGVLLVGI